MTSRAEKRVAVAKVLFAINLQSLIPVNGRYGDEDQDQHQQSQDQQVPASA